MPIIAISNLKGGVGKTTTSINLAAGLAKFYDKKVLVIDLDPQGNCTSGLGVCPENLPTVADLLCNENVSIKDVITKTYIPNLDLLPTDLGLSVAELKLATMCAREFKLRNHLLNVAKDYDFIIIDCVPSFGMLTINAFSSATDILMPVQLGHFSMKGIDHFIEAVSFANKQISPVIGHKVEIKHVLCSYYDPRPKLNNQIFSSIQRIFKDQIFKTTIPVNIKLNEAQSEGKSIFDFDEKCTGCIAYKNLVKEFLGRYQDVRSR